jgi:hypothetical protein
MERRQVAWLVGEALVIKPLLTAIPIVLIVHLVDELPYAVGPLVLLVVSLLLVFPNSGRHRHKWQTAGGYLYSAGPVEVTASNVAPILYGIGCFLVATMWFLLL